MQFFTTAILALAAAAGALATPTQTTTATYSTAYDVGDASLNSVACSNGANGLLTKGFTTLNSLPRFPYIGGAHAVSGWNSPLCGSCWQLGYKGKTIIMQAVDTSGPGFNLAKEAMNDLTNGEGIEAGAVQVTYSQVDDSLCQ